MAGDTFWSDTMNMLLSDSMGSSVEGPEAIIPVLAQHLVSLGHTVQRIEVNNKGTPRIHAHKEIFLACGANSEVVTQVEAFLSSRGVRFNKHVVVDDADHIDLGYDLLNVSVWR